MPYSKLSITTSKTMSNASDFNSARGIIFPATQLTQEQAIAFAENKRWESLDLKTRALFQIHQDRLCMPFDVFHEAVEKTLGRPVFTHEFALNPRLKDELMGFADAQTLDQIIALLPEDKTIVVSL